MKYLNKFNENNSDLSTIIKEINDMTKKHGATISQIISAFCLENYYPKMLTSYLSNNLSTYIYKSDMDILEAFANNSPIFKNDELNIYDGMGIISYTHNFLKETNNKIEDLEDYFTEMTDRGFDIVIDLNTYNKIVLTIQFEFDDVSKISTEMYNINRILDRWKIKTEILSINIPQGDEYDGKEEYEFDMQLKVI